MSPDDVVPDVFFQKMNNIVTGAIVMAMFLTVRFFNVAGMYLVIVVGLSVPT